MLAFETSVASVELDFRRIRDGPVSSDCTFNSRRLINNHITWGLVYCALEKKEDEALAEIDLAFFLSICEVFCAWFENEKRSSSKKESSILFEWLTFEIGWVIIEWFRF